MGNKSSKKKTSNELLDKEIAVLKANSDLSEQEIRTLYAGFKRESPSGKMNKKQFIEAYKEFLHLDEKGGGFTDHIFAIFDKNGDGSIDFSEFVIACGIGRKNDLDSELELAFAMLDTSGDGYISFDEMVSFTETALQLSEKTEEKQLNSKTIATEIFRMFGLDKNQNISKKQFIDGCKNNGDLADLFGKS